MSAEGLDDEAARLRARAAEFQALAKAQREKEFDRQERTAREAAEAYEKAQAALLAAAAQLDGKKT
jgi:hypothetical protein